MNTLNQWEQLVWQDIQSEGMVDDAVCKSSAGNTDRGQKSHTSSPAVSSLSDHRPSDVHLVAAAGDAGSGCLATGVEAATATGPQQAGSADVMPPPPDQEVNPFACPENQRLSGAPSGCLHVSCPDSLKPTASLVTFKTKALAAAAGSVRSGAVGSSLRMASIMYRSSSGGLADTLLSEQARAESGLLTAGLGRSDSLPELSLLPSALELSELISLRELDQLAGISSGLPSLSLLFGDPHADAQPAAHAAPAAAPFMDDMCVPLEMTSSKMLGRPSSFTANSAAALFAGSAAMVRPHLPVQHPAPEVPPSSSQHPALRPPAMVDYSPMVRLEQAAQGFQAPAAPAGPSALPGYPGLGAAPTSAAGGAEPAFEGFSFPSLGRMPPLMDRQDTFDVLIKQVDQELAAEAQIQQYAALEFDTMDIPLAPGPDMGASMVQSPFINATAASAAAAAVVPAVLRAAAQPGGAGEVVKRRSVFEGHHAGLVPSGVSAVSGASACTTAVGLDPTGPSFASWVAPADPCTSSFTSSAPSASASPFCLPSHNGIVAVADSSVMADDGVAEAVSAAVAAAAAGGTMARGKQEVARWVHVWWRWRWRSAAASRVAILMCRVQPCALLPGILCCQ